MTPTEQAIAWTLIHFCWQAAAVAAAYHGLSLLTARRSSNTRYLLALSALLLMLATSIATFAFEMRSGTSSIAGSLTGNAPAPYRISPVLTPRSGEVASTAAISPAASGHRKGYGESGIGSFSMPVLPLPALRLIDGLWVLGVFALSLRSLGGWWLIQRLRTSANIEAPAAVRESFRGIAIALGLRRPVLLRVSSSITGPVTVGALRALVLLPLSAAMSLSPDELEVVLAHELAHVRRADFFWNLVQTLVETLFFFHPAVWWLGNRIRHERELCCDDVALSVCPNPVVYANALFTLEQQRARPGQLAMALDGHQPMHTLRTRIDRILGEPAANTVSRGPFSLAAAAAILVVLLLPAPHVLAGLHPAPAKVATQFAATAPVVASEVAVVTARAVAPLAPASAASTIVVALAVPAPAAETAEPQQSGSGSDGEKGDYIDRMKAAGYDVDLDKLIAMKIQEITPEYAHAMSQLGFGKLSADNLIACKVQGVTPEYIASLKQGGLEVKTIQDAISYRIFSVTPEFIAGMKAAGFGGLSSKQLLSMRVQGVTPEYARSIAQQFPGATAEDLVKTRIFNIDAAFIESAKKHGFNNLSLEKLVKLRISGILDDSETK